MRFTPKIQTLLIFIFLSFQLTIAQEEAFSVGKISPYTALLLNTINESSDDSLQLQEVEKRFLVKRSNSVSYINAYIEFDKNYEDEVLELLEENNVKVNSVINNILTAKIPVTEIENTSLLPYIERVEAAIPVFPLMNKARPASNVDKVQEGVDLSVPYTGKDVIIGIIDGGFDYGHINFYDKDRKKLRIKKVWNQNITASNNRPTSFSYGEEYNSEEKILAAAYDRKTETHGTHVTGIASGADYYENNTFYGVAPEADLVFVSYDMYDNTIDNVTITDAVKYIYNYADAVNKPCVINMSLGSHIGPHDGTSTFDRLSDDMQGEGRLLVGAVGNEGSRKLHISKEFTTSDNLLQTFLLFRNTRQGIVDVWSEANKTFSIQIIIYNRETKEEVYSTDILTTNIAHRKEFQLTENNTNASANGIVRIIIEKNSENQKTNALVSISLSKLNASHLVGLKITANDGTVNAWADNSYTTFSNYGIENWDDGNSTSSMGEIGGTGNRIISVGAYTSNDEYLHQPLHDITDFSSHGPTADGRTKPEITAPGSAIVSSYSSYAIASGYSSRVVRQVNIENKNYYYGYLEGTSMAAPYVTGVLATWLQARKNLTPEETKRIIKKTAIQDEYTGEISENGSNVWGYGKIDAWNGIKECLELKRLEDMNPDKKIMIFKRLDEKNLSLLFPEDDKNLEISILCINKMMSSYKKESVYRNEIISLDLSGYASGLYFLYVKGSNKRYKVEKFIVK